jgi:hypothetical protein
MSTGAPVYRVLFQARNRRGMGHMMRGLNIARALSDIEPAAGILFYLRTAPPAGLWDDALPYVIEDNPDSLAHWPGVVAEFRPDVVVYDTMLPEDAGVESLPASARCVYVMRKCLGDRQRAIFANPFLERVDAIVVPHSAAEFGHAIPEHVRSRTTCVGPIVRLPDVRVQAALRSSYGIGDDDFVLTSTVGGGGYGAQAGAFFETIFDAHRRIAGAIPRLKHLVVQGPNYAGTLTPLPGMTVIAFEPEMVNLLALSDLVIAEGGYNTVNEIGITRTPAIFLPSERGHDDQEERVQALARDGCGFVYRPLDGAAVAAKVIELGGEAGVLQAIRDRYASDPVPAGNRHAARIIARVARR